MNLSQDKNDSAREESTSLVIADAPAENSQPDQVLSSQENDKKSGGFFESFACFASCSNVNTGNPDDISTDNPGLFRALNRVISKAASLASGKRLVFVGLILLAISIVLRHF
jgi:hypothetical protein